MCFDNKSISPSRAPSILVVGHTSEQRPVRFNRDTECRNINLLPIVYAFQPRLRIRLTLGGFTFPRKPWAYGERDSHPLYRYSYRHSHYHQPTPLLTVWLVSPVVRSPTDSKAISHQLSAFSPPRAKLMADSRWLTASESRSFGATLSPNHHRCPFSRPVSYYALFKWLLLLSQHPGCHRKRTSLRTQHGFGTLADGLGCFPFDHGH
jgi:hypothetical protein